MNELLSKDNICALALGIALLACIVLGYNDNVACTIAGSLGGVITGKALAKQNADQAEVKTQGNIAEVIQAAVRESMAATAAKTTDAIVDNAAQSAKGALESAIKKGVGIK